MPGIRAQLWPFNPFNPPVPIDHGCFSSIFITLHLYLCRKKKTSEMISPRVRARNSSATASKRDNWSSKCEGTEAWQEVIANYCKFWMNLWGYIYVRDIDILQLLITIYLSWYRRIMKVYRVWSCKWILKSAAINAHHCLALEVDRCITEKRWKSGSLLEG